MNSTTILDITSSSLSGIIYRYILPMPRVRIKKSCQTHLLVFIFAILLSACHTTNRPATAITGQRYSITVFVSNAHSDILLMTLLPGTGSGCPVVETEDVQSNGVLKIVYVCLDKHAYETMLQRLKEYKDILSVKAE